MTDLETLEAMCARAKVETSRDERDGQISLNVSGGLGHSWCHCFFWFDLAGTLVDVEVTE